MSEDPNSRLKAITDEEWTDILLRLFEYTRYKCRLLPGYMEPKDMACEALQLAFTGERQWNTDKDPEILGFLKRIVDSRWWNLWRKKDHKRFTSNEDELDKAMKNLSVECYDNQTELTTSGTEVGHEIDQRLRLIEEVVQGDSDLEEFYLAFEYGCGSIKEIASMLEWTKSKTYKVRRRLTMKLKEQQTSKVVDHD